MPTWDDYNPLAVCGEGAYGMVYLARCKQSNHMVAIKRVDQSLLIRVGKVGAAHREKQILTEIEEYPFAIKLRKTFKDDEHLYFVFEHCPFGTIGDLAEVFPDSRLPEHMAAFYAAEIVSFLQYIHH